MVFSTIESAEVSAESFVPVMSVVTPTRNEADSVPELLRRLHRSCDVPIEVLFVDDSDDETPRIVEEISTSGQFDPLVIRLVHRPPGERAGGLGGAVCEGLRRAGGTWVCVMDADLQHPPETTRDLLAKGIESDADLVVASRFLHRSAIEGFSPSRHMVSQLCATTARATFPRRLRKVTDPLSGFFMLRNGVIDPDHLHPHGFKILMEIIGRYPNLATAEVGFIFAERYAGVSKASVREGARFVRQLAGVRSSKNNLNRLLPGSVDTKPVRVYNYDIHGVLTVRSHARLPELEKFRVRRLDGTPNIVVAEKRFGCRDRGELIDISNERSSIRYDEKLGGRGFTIEVETGSQTMVWVSHLISSSPHVLYTNVVEPILRWKFVEKGYALVHAACFTEGDDAHLVTARTDTGKTTTMLKILELGDYGFLSDDLVLLDSDGGLLTYPKPLTISNHTVHALKSAELGPIERLFLPIQSRLHSKTGREFALYLAEKSIPVASFNAAVQRIIPPPKYHVERLVPGAPVSSSATLKTLTIIKRGERDHAELTQDEGMTILLENCEDAFGFPPYKSLETLLHTCSGYDLRFVEQEIIRRGLAKAETSMFSSPSLGWAEDIHTHVLQKDETDIAVPAAP